MTKPKNSQDQIYDVAIIGTGPAGYAASIYASRYNLSNFVIGAAMGGQAAESHSIQNYPSYTEISGPELSGKMKDHAEACGGIVVFDTVTSITGTAGDFTVKTDSGLKYTTKAIILAVGTKRRKLNIPGEDKFYGKGITYCATCDAMLFQGKVVAVVGGSDAANMASLHLVGIASNVYQIYRKDKLRGEPAWSEKAANNPDIEIIYNTNVIEAKGSDVLESITLDREYNGSNTLSVDGLFIEIGSEPDTTLMKQLGVKTDESGYIKVGKDQKTNIPGIWAAGDITTGSNNFRQVITAAAEGAIAAHNVFETLQS